MGFKRMVLHRIRGFTMEVHADQPQDALPDDLVELCFPEYRPRHRYRGLGKGPR
jgi:hypothetical protein